MNGSTFFNSGHVDYLDKNWTDTERSIKTSKPVSKNMFNDFEQRDYDFDDLEKKELVRAEADDIYAKATAQVKQIITGYFSVMPDYQIVFR